MSSAYLLCVDKIKWNQSRANKILICFSSLSIRSVETSDGQARSEQAEVRNPGQENEHLAVRGSYSWTVEGVTYTLNYVADENGFQPEGAHLPKSVV